jgi:hypothetical protein
MFRGEDGDELISANPMAFVLAAIIARRARFSDGFNAHQLRPGEAILGDYRRYGMTEQMYRTAKGQLEKWGFATFRTTNKGTIASLTDTRLFEVSGAANNEQANTQTTDGQRTANDPANGQATTNIDIVSNIRRIKKDQNEKNDQKGDHLLAIYEGYPKHVAKPQALKAIEAALRKMPFEALLAKTKAFAEHCRATGADPRFIPHPATWFNQERYNDALSSHPAQTQTQHITGETIL